MPTLRSLLTDSQTQWSKLELPWYGGKSRQMEIASGTAVWYHSGKPAVPIHWVLVRDPKGRYDPLALLSTDPAYTPEQIVVWFVRRWSVEVTFEEARTHLGVETQRQWSDLAIARTTPTLLGLFSWVTLAAHHLHQTQTLPVQQAAWYTKPLPTFADALATVRCLLWWHAETVCTSTVRTDMANMPRPFFDRLVRSL